MYSVAILDSLVIAELFPSSLLILVLCHFLSRNIPNPQNFNPSSTFWCWYLRSFSFLLYFPINLNQYWFSSGDKSNVIRVCTYLRKLIKNNSPLATISSECYQKLGCGKISPPLDSRRDDKTLSDISGIIYFGSVVKIQTNAQNKYYAFGITKSA